MTDSIGLPVGVFRLGRIIKYDTNTGKAIVKLANTSETVTTGPNVEISVPNGFYSDDGLFIGGIAAKDTPVVLSRGEGGRWYFISFLITNPAKTPDLKPGHLLVQTNKLTKIDLDLDNNINIGSDVNKIHINTKYLSISDVFDNKFSFTEASRNVDGIIKRDIKRLTNFPSSLKLTSDDYYNKNLFNISLDPTASSSGSFINQIKNPPFVEKRELVYEFAYSYNIKDDLKEGQLYQKSASKDESFTLPNRRESRSDLLSLSLVSPNYLMETIKGTVVDIFGNILDLNRSPIPIGSKDLTLKTDNGQHIAPDAFLKIKSAERRSLAYHFEINARKDLKQTTSGSNIVNLLDINSKDDYAKNRSRFFLDIDKEGQFKLNVPASSETGNVPLLTRYENYSTYGSEDNGNINKFIKRDDNLDIFLDSFAVDQIEIKDGDAAGTPIDRISNEHIKYGTPYHSIKDTCFTFQPQYSDFLDIQYNSIVDISSFPKIENIVSPTINISGANANAGGRSGNLHFDGFAALSFGANTVDRQSLWMDLAGSWLANIGRDKNNVSMAFNLDGDMLVQIGGNGVAGDSRFNKLNNAFRGGALDIRVLNEGFTVSIVRIDKSGVSIVTPNTMSLKARDITISADGNLILEGDNVSINDRAVLKFPAPSI